MNKKGNTVDSLGFEKSVIVPLNLYEKYCHLPEGIEKASSSDLRVKMADQKEWARKQVSTLNEKAGVDDWDKHRLADLKEKLNIFNPFLDELLHDYLWRYPSKVTWQPNTFEIVLDSRILPKTNIIRSLQYLLAPEKLNYQQPPGSLQLRNKLVELGVAEGWLYKPDTENVPIRSDTRARMPTGSQATVTPKSIGALGIDHPPTAGVANTAGRSMRDITSKGTTNESLTESLPNPAPLTPLGKAALNKSLSTPKEIMKTPPPAPLEKFFSTPASGTPAKQRPPKDRIITSWEKSALPPSPSTSADHDSLQWSSSVAARSSQKEDQPRRSSRRKDLTLKKPLWSTTRLSQTEKGPTKKRSRQAIV